MQALVQRASLLDGLKKVCRAIVPESQARMQILRCILIVARAGENTVSLYGTDLSICAQVHVEAEDVRETGVAVVPGRFLRDYVAAIDNEEFVVVECPQGAEQFSLATTHTSERGTRTRRKAQFKIENRDEFPHPPSVGIEVPQEALIGLPTESLKQMVKETAWAAEKPTSGWGDGTYCNLLLQFRGSALTLHGCDSTVLASRTHTASDTLAFQGEILLDAKDMSTIAEILDPKVEQFVHLCVKEDLLVIIASSLFLVVRRSSDAEKRREENEGLFRPEKTHALSNPSVTFTVKKAGLTKVLETLPKGMEKTTSGQSQWVAITQPEKGKLALAYRRWNEYSSGEEVGDAIEIEAEIVGELPEKLYVSYPLLKKAVSNTNAKELVFGITPGDVTTLSIDVPGESQGQGQASTLIACGKPKEKKPEPVDVDVDVDVEPQEAVQGEKEE